MPPDKTPRKPARLGQAGCELWFEVIEAHELRPDEVRMLEDACREADIVELLEDERAKMSFSLLVKGSQGQQVINPLISELRQHRATIAALLSKLKLADDSPEARSTAARAAVNVRWARRTG